MENQSIIYYYTRKGISRAEESKDYALVRRENELLRHNLNPNEGKSILSKKLRSYLSYQRKRRMQNSLYTCLQESSGVREIFQTSFLLCEIPLSLQEVMECGWAEDEWKELFRDAASALQGKAIWLEPFLEEYLDAMIMNYPISFLVGIYRAQRKVERVILIEGAADCARRLAEEIYADLNHLSVLTEHSEEWESFNEAVYRDTGLLINSSASLIPEYAGGKGRTMLFDFRKSSSVSYHSIPDNTVYIDLAPMKQKKRILEAKRKDIDYRTIANFLDIRLPGGV